jgi:predicted oxidoreductase
MKGRGIVRFCILAVGLTLAGCAAGGHIIQNMPDPPLPEDLSEPNYRQIVASNMSTIFPSPESLGKLEISGVRPVNHLRGFAWLTCLRIHADSSPQEYAIFILADKIIDQRAGVMLDRCKQQTFEAFEPSLFLQQANTNRSPAAAPRRLAPR